jgi:hypothetical protein
MAWALHERVIPPDSVRQEVVRQGLWNRYRCVWEGGNRKYLAEKPNEANQMKQKCDCCCSHRTGIDHDSATDDPKCQQVRAAKLFKGFSFIAALKCKGQNTNWLGVPISLAPPPLFKIEQFHPSDRITELIFTYKLHSPRPPTPPPRLGLMS